MLRPHSRTVPCGAALLLLLAPALLSCGKKGPPLPPLGKRPAVPAEVVARQQGGDLVLDVPIPLLRTDGSPLESTPAVVITRSAAGGAPRAIRRVDPPEVAAAPGETARVSLPLALVFDGIEGPRALVQVQLEGAGGRRSDPSAPIPLARSEPPPPPSHVEVRDEPDGVQIRWQSAAPEAEGLHYNVYRRAAGETGWGAPRNPEPIPDNGFLDEDVSYASRYTYQVRTVVPGARPSRESDGATAAEHVRRDRFPPAAPTDVRALAGREGIRVFWFPPADADLAACRVYRGAGEEAPQRIGERPPDEPSFLDENVEPGATYSYTVRCVDSADPPNEGAASDAAIERAARPVPRVDGPAPEESP